MVQKWDSKDTFCRLLAATVATEVKLNYHEIARMYGQGATYSSIEYQFRKIRKEAAELKKAATTTPSQQTPSDTATASFASNPSTPTTKTPRKPRARTSTKAGTAVKADEECGAEKVVGSRVAKRTATPKKKKVIKQEDRDDADMEDENVPDVAEGQQMSSHIGFGQENWDNDLADIDGDFENGFHGHQI